MEILYDTTLVEDVVFREIKRREAIGKDSDVKDYYDRHREIYERREDSREKLFEKLHEEFFLKFGFGKPILDVLSEFKEFDNKIKIIAVFKALIVSQEEASISNDSGKIGLRIHPEQFFIQPKLEAFIRHELKHISNMLDGNFKYRKYNKTGAVSPAQENAIRSRYKIIWDIFLDGRIARSRKETVVLREERFAEFRELYRSIPSSHLDEIFEALWNAEKLTHEEILAMARDFKVLIKKYSSIDEKELSEDMIALPGSPCPICKFPTFDWSKNLFEEKELVLTAIKKDYPWWSPEKGLCGRCLEVYKLRREWLGVS